MAYGVGVGLRVLLVEGYLSYGAGLKGRDNPLWWWPQPHGFLYMIYAVATFYLSLKVRWPVSYTHLKHRHARGYGADQSGRSRHRPAQQWPPRSDAGRPTHGRWAARSAWCGT